MAEQHFLSLSQEEQIAQLFLTKDLSLKQVARTLQGKIPYLPAIALDTFLNYLVSSNNQFQQNVKEAETRRILAQLGDFGQQLVYRKVSSQWDDKSWLPERSQFRTRLPDDLTRYDSTFGTVFQAEVAQLTKDINHQYRIRLTNAEIWLLLGFVNQRHKMSHANLTVADSLASVFMIIQSAKSLCFQKWPSPIEKYRKVVTKVIIKYEEVLGEANGLGINMWTPDHRFSGWLWEIAGNVEKIKKQQEQEKNTVAY